MSNTELPKRKKRPVDISAEAKFQERDLAIAMDFCDNTPHFDSTFIESLNEQFKTRGYLTENQYSALRNVMEKWHMEDWYEENN